MTIKNEFGAKSVIDSNLGPITIYKLTKLEELGIAKIERLPFSIRVILESVLRHSSGKNNSRNDVVNVAKWDSHGKQTHEIPFRPARVLLQDFTGVPAVVDLAALRSAIYRLGGDPGQINPVIPVDLVIDHSIQVDRFGSRNALKFNGAQEYKRNLERYEFLRWGQTAFDNFRVVPPATGIVHQVNLEYLAKVVQTRMRDGELIAFPDTLVGTDSHTTMINGLGVVGWGVGGIEAEATMLGQPIYMLLPEVVGFKLTGELPDGGTATDLVLTVTQMLRNKNVVGKFVEYYGPGVSKLSLADRATLANMSPEYGATMGYFPVDEVTLSYLHNTGRDPDLIELVESYTKEQLLFRTKGMPDPQYTDELELDMGSVVPSLAGPKRPQDRIPLTNMKTSFQNTLSGNFQKSVSEIVTNELSNGSVVIAAITSCTNTSNPSVMIAAGLLAKNAVIKGLRVSEYVKTSLAPGSRVVTRYLDNLGLTPYLESLGFHTVGYGCTSCIGNSGPLLEPIRITIQEKDLVVAAVLSGNRNFEGRVHPLTKVNFLASPPLVVAYALAGSLNLDLTTEPLGFDHANEPVFLKDIWPSQDEIQSSLAKAVTSDLFISTYDNVFEGDEYWNKIHMPEGEIYSWKSDSTYIKEPPFFNNLATEIPPVVPMKNARVLVLLGDSVTTDHISPAGAIPQEGPTERYLTDHGVKSGDFNSYGSRRGNHEIMMRGTFDNIRLRNLLVSGSEGGVTKYHPSGEIMSIFEAAMKYKETDTPLIVIGGKEYGTGSSRDWAAKGTLLLGVKAVIAESYERIHRSNLIGMGVLPLQFLPGENSNTLGLTGTEIFDFPSLNDDLIPGQNIKINLTSSDGRMIIITTTLRIDTIVEVDYYKNGGVLHTVLREMIKTQSSSNS
jgi:aconitate hydratase